MHKHKHSQTKIEISYIVAFLNDTNCRVVDGLQILKIWTLGNSLSVTQKVHDSRYGKSKLNNIVKIRSTLYAAVTSSPA